MDGGFKDKYITLHKNSVNYIWKIANGKLENGISLIELLNYNDVSLWWYLDLPLYYAIKRSLIDLNINKRIKIRNKTFNNLKITLIITFGLIFYFIRTLIRYICGRLIVKNSKIADYNILVPTASINWRNSNYEKKKKKDQMVGNVINELDNNPLFNVIACDIFEEFLFFGIKKIFEKKHDSSVWRPLEFYLNGGVLKKAFSSWFYYIKKWRKFKANKGFNKLFQDNGFNFYPYIENIFKKFFYFNLLNILLQIELLKNVIKQENIDLTFTFCDHCVQGRSTIIAGNKKLIPTISLQSSLIASNGREYIYSSEEMQKFPIPSIMALNGQYYKDLLIKGSSYPEDKLKIVGQPRYDFIFKGYYSKKNFCKKNGITCKKKLILVTTQPFGLEIHKTISDKFITAILRLEDNLEEMKIIIKPHPRENANYYKNLLKKSSIHILNEKYDTYDAINACDVLITSSSTTAVEAMIMKKPVLILNLSGEEKTPYTESGAAILVKKEENLLKTIKLLLFNVKVREELFKKQKDFLYQFIYLQDGKATERFIDLIKDNLKSIN